MCSRLAGGLAVEKGFPRRPEARRILKVDPLTWDPILPKGTFTGLRDLCIYIYIYIYITKGYLYWNPLA